MPKRTDIKKILVIGSGPIIMVRLLNSIMLEAKHVNLFVKKDMKLS